MLQRTNLVGLSVLSLVCASWAMVLSSPEPLMADPLSGAALFVVSAGANPVRGPALMDGSMICPSDYPMGFSIQCDAASTATQARFFVNGAAVKMEIKPPFYIAGDFNMRVIPWTTFPSRGTVSCQLNDGTSVSAMIDFTC